MTILCVRCIGVQLAAVLRIETCAARGAEKKRIRILAIAIIAMLHVCESKE